MRGSLCPLIVIFLLAVTACNFQVPDSISEQNDATPLETDPFYGKVEEGPDGESVREGHWTNAVQPAHAYPEWEDEITGAALEVPDDIATFIAYAEDRPSQPEGALPLPEAVKKALEVNIQGLPARVRLGPGIYRSILHVENEAAKGLLLIEGPEDGSAVMKGSEDWSSAARWRTHSQNQNLIQAQWTREWDDAHTTHLKDREGEHSPRIRGTISDEVSIGLVWKSKSGFHNPVFRLYRKALIDDQRNRYDGEFIKKTSGYELLYEGRDTGYLDTDLIKSETWMKVNYVYRVSEVLPHGSETGFSNIISLIPGDSTNIARPGQLGRRREMVFVDEDKLTQVGSMEALVPGTYYVDDGYPFVPEDGRLTVMLPEGKSLGECKIEVGTAERSWRYGPMWDFRKKENLLLRNLKFEHFPSYLANVGPLTLQNCDNVLIENCEFHFNNGAGLQIHWTDNLTLRNLTANDNGGSGIQWSGGHNIVAENLTTHRNNWRGEWGELKMSWAYAGIKWGFGCRGVKIKNHKAYDNFTNGHWIDYNVKNLVMDGLDMRDNKEQGIFIEALHGPVVLRNSIFLRNFQGIHLANTANGVLHNNVSIDNEHSQIHAIRRIDRPVKDQDIDLSTTELTPVSDGKGGQMVYRPVNVTNWTWTNNIAVSFHEDQYVVDVHPYEPFYQTLQASGNLYFSPNPEIAFQTGITRYGLDLWQQLSGQDLNAKFEDPLFVNILEDNFDLAPGSPLATRSEWPTTEHEEYGYHRIASVLIESAERTNRVPFPHVVDVTPERFMSIDLTQQANHPLDGTNNWARTPLEQLTAGTHTFHGVPFAIADHPEWGASGIALMSSKQRPHPSGSWPKAVHVQMPDEHVERFYILHVGNFSIGHLPIAYYIFHYADGSSHSVDIFPFGKDFDDGPTMEGMKAVATIQDWWPTWTHFEKDDVKPVMLINEGNPAESLRYAYALEIPNPHPEKRINHMEFKIRYSNGAASPMLLALTCLVSDVAPRHNIPVHVPE